MPDRFFIGAFDKDSGLQKQFLPWLIPDEAFAEFDNAYAWRGRVRKRFGSYWLGNTQQSTRLRGDLINDGVLVGMTDGSGNLSGTVADMKGFIGQRFQIGDIVYTVTATGNMPMTQYPAAPNTATKTFNTGNGKFVFVGAAINSNVYFYRNINSATGIGTTDGNGFADGQVFGTTFAIGQAFSISDQLFYVNNDTAGLQPMLSNVPPVQIDTTDNAGNAAGIAPALRGDLGQQFFIGTQAFTVTATGLQPLTVTGQGTGTGTYNTGTLAYTFAGAAPNTPIYFNQISALYDATVGYYRFDLAAANEDIYFYPALPVMGLPNWEQSLSPELTIAFDTENSYLYQSGSGWNRINGETNPGDSSWTGSNSQFFWGTNWTGVDASTKVFYVTNFNENEPNFMRYLINIAGTPTWTTFEPEITLMASGATLDISMISALILVPFKNSLVALNVWELQIDADDNETVVNYQNRARWCKFNADPTAADSWRQDIPGNGNGLDAPTNQAIVTVEFVKDRLIVYFESSTWEFVYTNNKVYPYAWQQINTELGAESTFSVVPFDQFAIGIGNVGIHTCSGTNVQRIDINIPDEVWNIHNGSDGIKRVYGIRDYFAEMVYWTFPDETANDAFPYPSRVLVFNYRNNTWAFNDDSFTAFGYIQLSTGITWDSQEVTWDDNASWDSGELDTLFKNIVAGNQTGWTFIIDINTPVNAPAIEITNITIGAGNQITIQSPDHNLRIGDFVYLQDILAIGTMAQLNNQIFKITIEPDEDDFIIVPQSLLITGVYQGGGTVQRMSLPNILTKQFNFYFNQGRNAYISEVDFQVDATGYGTIQVDYFASTNTESLLSAAQANGTLLGSGSVSTAPYPTIPFEQNASRLVHPLYLQAEGEFIQLQISMSDLQMTTVVAEENPDSTFTYTGPAFEDLQIHSMTFWAQPTTTRNR